MSKQGYYFMWTEVEGKRSSCEIATYLYTYFKSLPNCVEQITCFSDRCGGQNLNKFVAAMYLTAVKEIPHLQSINLKFLVVRHRERDGIRLYALCNFHRSKKSWQSELAFRKLLQNARKERETNRILFIK